MKIISFLILLFLVFQVQVQVQVQGQGQESKVDTIYLKSHLEFMRDIKLPIQLDRISKKLEVWKVILGPNWKTHANWPIFQNYIQGLENEQQNTASRINGLKDSAKISVNTKLEFELKNYLQKNKKLKRKYGGLWNQMENLAKEREELEYRLQFHSPSGLGLLEAGMNIVRVCDPAETKKDITIAKEELKSILHSYLNNIIQDNHLKRAIFANHVNTAHKWLQKKDPYLKKVCGGKSGEDFLKMIYGDSIMGSTLSLVAYTEKHNSLISAGWDAIKQSEDPVLLAARELVALMRENEKLEEELNAKEKALYEELSQAFSAVLGKHVIILNSSYDYVFGYDYYYLEN